MVKSVSYITLLLSLMFGYVVTAGAQQQKVGYVDTDYILSQMSEYESVQQQLQSISSGWNSKIKEMEEEIEQLEEEFQSKKVLYTDEEQEQKEQEIQSNKVQRQQYLNQKFGSEGEYFQQQKELLAPIQRAVFEAINTVAERQNFDFVFDQAQNSGLLYGGDEFNLNGEVLQELGITLNESSN